MTKEPKLQGARRIVKEWPGYDEQVMAFTAQVESILEGNVAAEGEEGNEEMSSGDVGTGGDGELPEEGQEARRYRKQHDASEF
jgi:hypothetical protein